MSAPSLPPDLRRTLRHLARLLSSPRAHLSHFRASQFESINSATKEAAFSCKILIELIDTDGLVMPPPARVLTDIRKRDEAIEGARGVNIGFRARQKLFQALENACDELVCFEQLALAYAKLRLDEITGPGRKYRTAAQLLARRDLPSHLASLETSLSNICHLVQVGPKSCSILAMPEKMLHAVGHEVERFCAQAVDPMQVATEGGLKLALMDLQKFVDGVHAELMQKGWLVEERGNEGGETTFAPATRRAAVAR